MEVPYVLAENLGPFQVAAPHSVRPEGGGEPLVDFNGRFDLKASVMEGDVQSASPGKERKRPDWGFDC